MGMSGTRLSRALAVSVEGLLVLEVDLYSSVGIEALQVLLDLHYLFYILTVCYELDNR